MSLSKSIENFITNTGTWCRERRCPQANRCGSGCSRVGPAHQPRRELATSISTARVCHHCRGIGVCGCVHPPCAATHAGWLSGGSHRCRSRVRDDDTHNMPTSQHIIKLAWILTRFYHVIFISKLHQQWVRHSSLPIMRLCTFWSLNQRVHSYH